MKTIKSISSHSVARLFGIMYAMLGIIFGILFYVIGLVSKDEEGTFGLLFVVLFPILYGVLGWVGGYIMGFLYNFVAMRFGGIQFEVE